MVEWTVARDSLNVDEREALLAVPGVRARGFRLYIPDNALDVARTILGSAHPFREAEEPVSPAAWARPYLRDVAVVKLLRFQEEGILFALGRPDASALLVHPTGSGKTLSAIIWALAAQGTTVVVTKAAVVGQWASEVKAWSVAVPVILEGMAPRDIEGGNADDPPRFLILSYAILSAWIDKLVALHPTSVVFDEIQKAKAHGRWEAIVDAEAEAESTSTAATARSSTPEPKVKFKLKDNTTASAMRLSRVASRRLATTATPITDRVRDLWAELDLVQPRAWGAFWPWARRYCAAAEGLFGMEAKGATNMEELGSRLRRVAHFVPAEVVRAQLPPMRRRVSYIRPSEQSRPDAIAKEIQAAARRGPTALLEARLMEAAARKRRVVVDRIKDAVASGQKVVAFTGRRIDAERLAEVVKAAFGGSLWMAHGGHSPEAREKIRILYMGAPGPAVLIGTGDAWGECVTPDTILLGDNKAIGDYEQGDRIVGERGLGVCRKTEALHPWHSDIVEICAQGLLPLTATPNHAVLTASGGVTTGRDRRFLFRGGPAWKGAEEIIPWNPSPTSPKQAHGDFLLIPRVPGSFSDVIFDLNRYVTRPRDVAARLRRGCPVMLHLDAGTAWLMGLYAAEGSATDQHRPGGCRASFSLGGHERSLARRVVKLLGERGFAAHIREQETWINVVAGSGPFARLLRTLMGAGAKNKRIPNEILFHADLRILRAFLDGYVLGDGSVYDGGNKIQAATVSKVLALQLQLALARFGRLAGITPWQAKPGKIKGREIRGGPYFIVTWRWRNLRHERFKVLDRHIATPVKAVRRVPYRGEVVGIKTADHTFLASNAVVHNGLNLQDTDLALMVMLPYTPGQVIQWEGRFPRLGQVRPVLVEYLIAEGTVDEHVAGILLDKLPAVEVLGGSKDAGAIARDLIGDESEIVARLVAMLEPREERVE